MVVAATTITCGPAVMPQPRRAPPRAATGATRATAAAAAARGKAASVAPEPAATRPTVTTDGVATGRPDSACLSPRLFVPVLVTWRRAVGDDRELAGEALAFPSNLQHAPADRIPT